MKGITFAGGSGMCSDHLERGTGRQIASMEMQLSAKDAEYSG